MCGPCLEVITRSPFQVPAARIVSSSFSKTDRASAIAAYPRLLCVVEFRRTAFKGVPTTRTADLSDMFSPLSVCTVDTDSVVEAWLNGWRQRGYVTLMGVTKLTNEIGRIYLSFLCSVSENDHDLSQTGFQRGRVLLMEFKWSFEIYQPIKVYEAYLFHFPR